MYNFWSSFFVHVMYGKWIEHDCPAVGVTFFYEFRDFQKKKQLERRVVEP